MDTRYGRRRPGNCETRRRFVCQDFSRSSPLIAATPVLGHAGSDAGLFLRYSRLDACQRRRAAALRRAYLVHRTGPRRGAAHDRAGCGHRIAATAARPARPGVPRHAPAQPPALGSHARHAVLPQRHASRQPGRRVPSRASRRRVRRSPTAVRWPGDRLSRRAAGGRTTPGAAGPGLGRAEIVPLMAVSHLHRRRGQPCPEPAHADSIHPGGATPGLAAAATHVRTRAVRGVPGAYRPSLHQPARRPLNAWSQGASHGPFGIRRPYGGPGQRRPGCPARRRWCRCPGTRRSRSART